MPVTDIGVPVTVCDRYSLVPVTDIGSSACDRYRVYACDRYLVPVTDIGFICDRYSLVPVTDIGYSACDIYRV